jgi:hypothetical protein
VADSQSDAADISIDFTTEELQCLGADLELDLSRVLDLEITAEATSLDVARRGLVARRVLEPCDVIGGTVALPVASLMDIVAQPALLVVARILAGGSSTEWRVLAVPEVAVLHEIQGPAIHRFTPFATDELLIRLFGLLAVADRAAPLVRPFQMSAASFSRLMTLGESGDHEGAALLLDRERVQAATAEAFVKALIGRDRLLSVLIASQQEPDTTVGGAVEWVDSSSGMWLLPIVDDDIDSSPAPDFEVTIEPITPQGLADILVGYLPPSG